MLYVNTILTEGEKEMFCWRVSTSYSRCSYSMLLSDRVLSLGELLNLPARSCREFRLPDDLQFPVMVITMLYKPAGSPHEHLLVRIVGGVSKSLAQQTHGQPGELFAQPENIRKFNNP